MARKKRVLEPMDIEALREKVSPVDSGDTMAEAGRKILYNSFVFMLEREAGSRSGEDIEDVHRMRVATRRMRSAFRLFKPYFKPKAIRPFTKSLKTLADALGNVRDLDVIIRDLTQYQTTLDETGQAALRSAIDRLDDRRRRARDKLIAFLDSTRYQKFAQRFAVFLTTPGKGAKPVDKNELAPYQVRHILPVIVHHQLAAVRAYDTVLDNHAKPEILHALRISFKRLRYTLSHFEEVLGATSKQFVSEIKFMQDYLGRLNDIAVARTYLAPLSDDEVLDEALKKVLRGYLSLLAEEEAQCLANFPDAWDKFNTRAVQRKLSDSLLVLR